MTSTRRQRREKQTLQREARAMARDLNRMVTKVTEKALRGTYLDPRASRLRKRLDTAYAGLGGRGDANSALAIDRHQILGLSRALYYQSDVYRGLLHGISRTVVGRELRGVVRARPDRNPAVETPEERAFALFMADGAAKKLDSRRMMHWGRMQRAALLEMLKAGDVLGVWTSMGVAFIEAERIGRPWGRGTNSVTERESEGVKLDALGGVTGYEVAQWDPLRQSLVGEPVTIAADRAMLLAHRDEMLQHRGNPFLATNMGRLLGVDEIATSYEMAIKLASHIALIIYSENPEQAEDAVRQAKQSDDDSGSRTDNLMDVGPGSLLFLNPGDKAMSVQGQQPVTAMDAFVRMVMVLKCSAIGMPLEAITLDLSRLNLSTARVAMQLAERGAQPIRDDLVADFHKWVLGKWAARAALDGRIDVRPEQLVAAVRWLDPPMIEFDPVRERTAAIAGINANLTTLESEIEMRGGSLEETLRQRQYEVQRQRELEISPVLAPGAKTADDAGAVGDASGVASGGGGDPGSGQSGAHSTP